MCCSLIKYVDYDGASSVVATLKDLTMPMREVFGGHTFSYADFALQGGKSTAWKVGMVCLGVLLLPVTLLMALGLVLTNIVSNCSSEKEKLAKAERLLSGKIEYHHDVQTKLDAYYEKQTSLRRTIANVLAFMEKRTDAFDRKNVEELFRSFRSSVELKKNSMLEGLAQAIVRRDLEERFIFSRSARRNTGEAYSCSDRKQSYFHEHAFFDSRKTANETEQFEEFKRSLLDKYSKTDSTLAIYLKAAGVSASPRLQQTAHTSRRDLVPSDLDDGVDCVVYEGQAARDHLHEEFSLPGRAATEEEVQRATEVWASAVFNLTATARRGVEDALSGRQGD